MTRRAAQGRERRRPAEGEASGGGSRIEQLRARIADVALDLFLHRGFARTGVREIASRSGVSVGSIFNYFESKEDILFTLISEMQKGVAIPLQAAASEYRARATAGEDPERALLALLHEYARAVNRWRRHLLLGHQEARSLPRPHLQQILDGERRMRDLLADLIQLGVERGKFTPGDLRFRAHAIQILTQSWATRHWALEGSTDFERFVAMLERAVLGMLEAPDLRRVQEASHDAEAAPPGAQPRDPSAGGASEN